MTYIDRDHLHNREVKLRLDARQHERLKKIANSQSTQPAVFVRMYVEALLEKIEKEGFGPVEEFIEQRKRA